MGRYRRSCVGLLPALALLGVTGCASSNPPRLATCNGKHLRDVNIYGTVLPGGTAPAAPEAGEEPPPPPKTGARSDNGREMQLASLRPCRGQG